MIALKPVKELWKIPNYIVNCLRAVKILEMLMKKYIFSKQKLAFQISKMIL